MSETNARDASHPVFKNRNLSAENIDKLADLVNKSAGDISYETHIQRGHELRWVATEVVGNHGRRKEVFPAWYDKSTDKPIAQIKNGRINALKVVLPPGPIRDFYLSVPQIFRFDDIKTESAFQKVNFWKNEDDYDTEKFRRYRDAVKALDKFLNEDRVEFLAHNIDKHDMLTKDQRNIGRKDPEELTRILTEALRTKGYNTQHECSVTSAKRKIFRDGEKRNGVIVSQGVCDVDKITLSQLADPGNIVSQYLEQQDGAKRLNLYNITMPDTTHLSPAEYDLLHPEGAVGALEVSVYGIYCRLEKGEPQQHSVMLSATGLQVFTNGKSANGGSGVVNVMQALAEPEEKSPPSTPVLARTTSISEPPAVDVRKHKRKNRPDRDTTKKPRIVFDNEA